MHTLQVILGSTRQGRMGEKVMNWVKEELTSEKEISIEYIDLRDWQMPFFDESISPSYRTQPFEGILAKWAEKVASADGYLIITPEYNHGYPAVLKNALDQLFYQWNNKPVGFVSYGGVAGGSRAVEQLRQVVDELKMVAMRDAVHIPLVWEAFDEQGKYVRNDDKATGVKNLVSEIKVWMGTCQKVREQKG